MQTKVYLSEITNPFANLAIENDLLLNCPAKTRILFLYVNKPCVVMGRFQNPWLETNRKFMLENDIPLVRRQSGGGCVFHDLGNLNYSFIHSERDFHKEQNHQVIIEALKAFDIKAKTQGQSNLVVETSQGERKISGSAFKQKKDRSFHHGTLLIDSDIELLINCLKDQKLEIESKSIDSNRAKSINLKELNPTIELQNMVDRIIQCFGPKNISKFTQRDFTESMQTESNRLQSWDWLIGETPYFEARVESKKLMSKKGLILEGSEIGEIGSRVQSLLDK